jgi:hypothetical protein
MHVVGFPVHSVSNLESIEGRLNASAMDTLRGFFSTTSFASVLSPVRTSRGTSTRSLFRSGMSSGSLHAVLLRGMRSTSASFPLVHTSFMYLRTCLPWRSSCA